MTEPFLGEVQLLSFNFAPRGWALCNGATVAIQQYSTLFSLLGTNYGGNGTSTFQLPNLMSRSPCGQGAGPGLSPRTIGETIGEQTVSLLQSQIPMHTHQEFMFNGGTGREGTPTANAGFSPPINTNILAAPPANTTFSPTMIQPAGGGQPHPNQQPFLAMTYAIALAGVYPSFQ
jgi:microcystin-dependent protein